MSSNEVEFWQGLDTTARTHPQWVDCLKLQFSEFHAFSCDVDFFNFVVATALDGITYFTTFLSCKVVEKCNIDKVGLQSHTLQQLLHFPWRQ